MESTKMMELKKNQISCPQKKWQKSYYVPFGTVKTVQTSQTQKLPEPDRYEIGRVKALLKYLKDFVYLGHKRLIPTCFVFEIYDNRGKFIGNAFPEKYFLEDGQLVMTFSDVDPRQYFSNRVWSDEFFGLLVQGGLKLAITEDGCLFLA